MKNALVLGALFFSQLALAAPRPDFIKQYLGKYSATSKSCPAFKADRIYLSLQEDFAGNDLIQIEFYGQDAAVVEFLLDSGERPVPGGNSGDIQSWETYFVEGDNLFSVVKNFIMSPEDRDFTETAELSLRDGGKTLIYTAEDPWGSVVCEMKRVN